MTEVELLEYMLANVKQGLPAGRGILDRYMRPITDDHLAVIDLRGWRELSIPKDPGVENPAATINKEWIERAIEEYVSDDIAVDTNAEVSVGDEGVWVQAWVFVKN